MVVPPEFADRLATWSSSAYLYYVVGYAALAVGILSGLAITAFAEHLGTRNTRVLGFVTAACTAFLATFTPIEIGHNFRSAWRLLDRAALEYKFAKDGEGDVTRLIAAIEQGEEIIGTLDPGSKSPKSTSATQSAYSNGASRLANANSDPKGAR